MGYRSEVYIGIVKEQEQEFNKLNKDNSFNRIWEAEDVFIYYGDYLKWYDTYEDVIEMNKLVKSNEDNFMVCIGEQDEVHSEIGQWYDYINIKVTAELYKLK